MTKNEPFGTLLGFAPGGVAIYSSDYNLIDKSLYTDDASFRSYIGREYMGYKWQCVEFARRFLFQNLGLVFPDVGMAYEIFSLRFVRRVINDAFLPLQAYENGGLKKPEAGALLIWDKGGEFTKTGHVAIITEVLNDKVRIVEQNVIHHKLPIGQQWTRELSLTSNSGCYTINDTFDDTHILGWMIQTSDTQLSLPRPKVEPNQLNIQSLFVNNHKQYDSHWLNKEDPINSAYIDSMKGDTINDNMYHYYAISDSAKQELIRATNELHLMYLHATDKVLQDDELLSKFNIPKILWPRLRLSWQQRRYETITGRLDFCMDERGLKVYEYNADSASCHTETGYILKQWAAQSNDVKGSDPGESLLDNLIDCWKHSNAYPFVHIMQDFDEEENYHALFMQKALNEANFETKIIQGLEGLRWDEQGQIVDEDGRVVKCVWKTWAWETVLEQLREESEDQALAPPVRTGHPKDTVRLIDVLLRPEIKVYEPIWTLIPSNKSILPVLWSLFPNHRYLLEAEFEVTSSLIETGYAIKPIGGRCGNNINLISHQDESLDKTEGRFDHQENIYQQLWCLPKVAEHYVQICAFTTSGHYAGCCIRQDKSLVIKGESDMAPLRVILDENELM